MMGDGHDNLRLRAVGISRVRVFMSSQSEEPGKMDVVNTMVVHNTATMILYAYFSTVSCLEETHQKLGNVVQLPRPLENHSSS